jgi:hypothetical protein
VERWCVVMRACGREVREGGKERAGCACIRGVAARGGGGEGEREGGGREEEGEEERRRERERDDFARITCATLQPFACMKLLHDF